MRINRVSFIAGFLLLFAVYHFPEFFNAFWIMAVFKIGFLLVAFGLACYQGFRGLGGYALNMHPGWISNLGKGLLTGIVFFGLSVFVSVLLGYEQFLSVVTLAVFAKQLPLVLFMTFFPSIAEDILTRGYLYGHLKDSVTENNFVILSAAVFVLNHFWRLADHPSVHTYLFLMGMATAFALWRSGSLWMAFGIHWGSNIAYETNLSLIKTEAVTTGHMPNWMLAASFGLLIVFLAMIPLQRKQSPG